MGKTNGRRAGQPTVQYHSTISRWPPRRDGHVTNTVYPIKYMVVIGELTTGFMFYGPFNTVDKAGQWATANLKAGMVHRIHNMFDVRDA